MTVAKPLSGSGVYPIDLVKRRSEEVLRSLRNNVFAPEGRKTLRRCWNIQEAAKLVGRSAQTIRNTEAAGLLPTPPRLANGRREGYSLELINNMRAYFSTRPWRSDDDEPVVLSFSNFKGGVGKSAFATHSAQYFATRGYRVLLIDLDSQASTTTLFGYNPDLEIEKEHTLTPYLLGDESTLEYAVRHTHWPGIDMIPSALHFYNAEYEMAAQVSGNVTLLESLKFGIATIADRYDLIILDPPPALGLISISALIAASALVIPVPPSNTDFASTTHFFSMLLDTLGTLRKHGVDARYKFFRLALSKYDERKSTQVAIADVMKRVFGEYLLKTPVKDSAEIDNASARFETVYEQQGPLTSRETHQRCLEFLDGVNREIEILVRHTWPSQQAALREEGLLRENTHG